MLSFRIDDQLELKLMELSDAQEAYSVVDFSRDFIGEWLPWVEKTTSMEDYREFIKFARSEFANETSYHFGIFEEGIFIGGYSFNKIDRTDNKVEIGYWISKSHKGKGIVSRITKRIIDFCFNEWDVHRIEIHVASTNEASKRIPERFGFHLDGVMRDGHKLFGKYYDLNIYSLLNPNHKDDV